MRVVRTTPGGVLHPFVEYLWASEAEDAGTAAPRREHVLPTGRMHLVIRLSNDPIRVFRGPKDELGQTFWSVVGGARDRFHQRFLQVFREAVGLAPKAYAQVARFQRALSVPRTQGWAEVAVDAGFSDQAHLSRQFRQMAGVSPAAYARLVLRHPLHVPAPGTSGTAR